MKNNLTLNDILSDIMCTEKSYAQEMKFKKFTMIVRGHYTKTDLRDILLRIMPTLQIEKIGVNVVQKKQYSKATAKQGGYLLQLGSNRSHIKGTKKFYVNIANPDVLVNYLQVGETNNG